MGIKVFVREGESIDSALRRLQRAARDVQKRAWYKGSRGFHEKPSRKRHKRKLIDRLKFAVKGQFCSKYMFRSADCQFQRSENLFTLFCRGGNQSWARRKEKKCEAEQSDG